MDDISPAFKNQIDRAFFSAILVTLLVLPFFGHYRLYQATDVYNGVDARGSIEKGHIDVLFGSAEKLSVAFIGLSSMWVGVDARSLEEELNRVEPGHSVALMGANHPGEDLVFTLASQLLKTRGVELLVLSTPGRGQMEPHPMIHRIINLQQHIPVLKQLSLSDKAAVYALSVLGTPGQVLNRIREPKGMRNRRGLSKNNGSWIRSVGWNRTDFSVPDSIDCCAALGTYLPADYDQLQFEDVTTNFQRVYLDQTLAQATQQGARIAILSPPLWRDRRTETPVIRFPREVMEKYNVPIIAQSGVNLFGSLSDEQIQTFFYNANHLNTNGAERLTRSLVAPISQLLDQ